MRLSESPNEITPSNSRKAFLSLSVFSPQELSTLKGQVGFDLIISSNFLDSIKRNFIRCGA